MKVIDIPIKAIEIGERRRSSYGSIAGLAKGMKRVGLLQPIIVDRQENSYRLVAGGRRLKAAELLKWKTIPVSLRDTLSDDELRDIELEENENRKNLTERERNKTFRASKKIVEDAKKAAELLSSTVDDKPKPRGHQAKYGSPKEDIAEAVGVSKGTLVYAEQHVELAERYPWLQGPAWRQADVLKMRKNFERISIDERDALYRFIEEAALPLDPRPDRVLEYSETMTLKTPEERAEIYRLWQSDHARDKALARTRSLHRPPMPDVRSTFIGEALVVLKKALKSPFDKEPEAEMFRNIMESLKALNERLEQRYEEFKRTEAEYVETDLRRREAISAGSMSGALCAIERTGRDDNAYQRSERGS